MKRGIKNLAIATMVGVASMGLMTGCVQNSSDSKPYIQVEGLDTTYMLGEDLNLEGAKILYYSDKNDTTADEVRLQESMIANFNTDTSGEKKMKVLWNGFELEVSYSVLSTTEFINAYNTAYNNFINSGHAYAEVIATMGQMSQKVAYNVADNKLYQEISYMLGGNSSSGVAYKEWIQKVDSQWISYSDDSEMQARTDVTDSIQNNNVISYLASSVFKLTDGEGNAITQLNDTVLSHFDSIEYTIDGNKTILTFVAVDTSGAGMNSDNPTHVVNISIVDEKVVEIDGKYIDEDGVTIDWQYSIGISYKLEDVTMESLPADANDWQMI